MAGRLFAVVGPSGAGKDTLIDAALAARPDLYKARRVITRPADLGGETFEGVTEATFDTMRAEGRFALDWQAHGLSYGVPKTIEEVLAEGRDVIFNGSRAMLVEAQQRYPTLQVLLVCASGAVLAQRLAARGRESRSQIEARLARASYDLDPRLPVQRIHNDGDLATATAAMLAALAPAEAPT